MFCWRIELQPTTVAPPDLLPTLDLPRRPKQRRSQSKWERLLIAGQVVFDRVGYTHATVDAITAEAKVSTGTFYRYVRDKRQLLLVLVGEALDVVADDLRTIDLSSDPYAAIEQLVQVLVDPGGGYHGLWRAWAEVAAQDSELASSDRKITAWLSGLLLDRLERVSEHAPFRPGLDRTTTAHLTTTLLRQLSLGAGDDPEAAIHAASSLISHALLPDRPPMQRVDEAR